MRYKIFILPILLFIVISAFSQEKITYKIKTDIFYYPDSYPTDDYIKERCKLDIYYPENTNDFPTIVWFHGGGLQNGNKFFPETLKNEGICIVSVNYRLSPKAKAPAYIQDAAASVAWTFKNIEAFGGNADKIFISGHSAGGYLTSMVGLDKRWLEEFGIDANQIAGLFPLSGQCITHSTIREERGLTRTDVVVDDLAPLAHVREDAPPLVLFTGDKDLDMPARYEENVFLNRMMNVAGHKQTKMYEMQGYTHMMTYPAFPLVIEEIRQICEMK